MTKNINAIKTINSGNIIIVVIKSKNLFANKDVDGGLIGGASLTARAFAGIVEAARGA